MVAVLLCWNLIEPFDFMLMGPVSVRTHSMAIASFEREPREACHWLFALRRLPRLRQPPLASSLNRLCSSSQLLILEATGDMKNTFFIELSPYHRVNTPMPDFSSNYLGHFPRSAFHHVELSTSSGDAARIRWILPVARCLAARIERSLLNAAL
jgi:hypothetical protein